MYNVQGDVVGLARATTGKIVATYEYDAWGNCSVTNASGYTIGDENPFRYRGYYWDEESGLYYLNSRYYNPEVGRFISADDTGILTLTPDGLTDKNLYAYCDNNPIVRTDGSGEVWHYAIIAAAIEGSLQLAGQLLDNGGNLSKVNWSEVGWAAVPGGAGALKGAVIGGAIGAATGAAVIGSKT